MTVYVGFHWEKDDKVQIERDGNWEDYSTIRTEDDALHARALVVSGEDPGYLNHPKTKYRVVRGEETIFPAEVKPEEQATPEKARRVRPRKRAQEESPAMNPDAEESPSDVSPQSEGAEFDKDKDFDELADEEGKDQIENVKPDEGKKE
jgi:hypothetical protein